MMGAMTPIPVILFFYIDTSNSIRINLGETRCEQKR